MRIVICLLVLAVQIVSPAQSLQTLDAKSHHLRSGDHPEWEEFAASTPEARRLDLSFKAQSVVGEATLLIRQDNVKQPWTVELNGTKIGQLFLMESPLVHALPFAGSLLRDGTNKLSVIPPRENDDIVISEIQLLGSPLRDAVRQSIVECEVIDVVAEDRLPSRITVIDERGALAPLYAFPDQHLAVRPGVAYTADGKARLGLLPGKYQIYATRGFEYSVARQPISLQTAKTEKVRLAIRREVPTAGWVSSDTHVHTFSFSRHGDATVEERAITLAGEGIELPIATDHEYLADYAEPARKMGVAKYFTPVVGCETTTPKGHFNSFPIQLGSKVPDFRITDWPQLMQTIRSTPGVRVVILNHPRNVHSEFQPFAATNFNAVTGENRRGLEFSFDAIEVANSSALQSDWMINFHDWMALLNYGYRVTAVGSSDGHDVSRYIVGQGRSYVRCRDDDPGKLDVNEACESFLKGRVLVSLGLLADLTVNRKFKVGNLATGLGSDIQVEVTVLAPSWISADKLELYANGVKVYEQAILQRQSASGSGIEISWRMPRPKHDLHLIAIASGPGVREQYWAVARPYQPSSPVWSPRVIGATNPIWVDADGDGKYTSPRAYAKQLVERHTRSAELIEALQHFDPAIAAQAAGLLHQRGENLRRPELGLLLQSASPAVQNGFAAYMATIPPR